MLPKSKKNKKKLLFKIAFDFRIVFDTIFPQIFLDFRSHRTPKIKLKRWSVVIFYTFSDFRLGSLLESIQERSAQMPSTPDTTKAIPCYVTSTFDWRRAFIEGAREARGPKGPLGAKAPALRAPWASQASRFLV